MIECKIRISQLIAKILLKQWSLNQIGHCLTGHNQIWHHFFIKKYWSILMNFKSKFLNFMTNVNQNNGNEIKSDIFRWDMFKSDTISSFHQQILKYFNDFQNRNFSVLWLKWTETMDIKQNRTFFYGTYSNLTS